MRGRGRRAFSIALAAAFLTATMFSAGCGGETTETTTSTEAEEPAVTTVTDLAGREVEVQLPVQRVVLASARHIHEFGAVGGEGVLDTIVGWGSDLELYDADTYQKYVEEFPDKVDAITDVGYSDTFDAEAVIALEPDVVVFPGWSTEDEAVLVDIDKLAEAGIPSVFVDYYNDPYVSPVESTLLIGTLLGEEDRAQEIVDYYQEQLDIVANTLAEIEGDQPQVYVEVGSEGPEMYGNTYGDSGLGAVVTKAGGINIAEGDLGRLEADTEKIDPEYLIDTNPDVIIISGSHWETAGSMWLGYYANEAESRSLLKAFTERTGWDTLDAVQQGHVYSSFHGFSFRIYNFAGVQAFAKWFYPEEFADLDPAANFQEFHERFEPVSYSGVWMLGVSEE